MGRIINSFVFLFFACSIVFSQQAKFTATTDATQIIEGGYVDITFTLENAEGNSFKPPKFNDFDVAGGPSTSTSMTIINGRVSQKMSYTYNLIAKKQGKYTIGPASIFVGSNNLKSNPVNIEVLKLKEKEKRADGTNAIEDIFVELELSDSTTYIGQQITANYILYRNKDVRSADFVTEPSYDGFYAKRLRGSGDRGVRIVIDGVQYVKSTIRSEAIFPQQTGTFTIDPVYINLGLPIKDGRRNSFFFNTRTKNFRVNTIGKYTMSCQIDKRNISTDDALTITMTINGVGDGKFIEAPTQTHDAFDFYDPNVIHDETVERSDQLRVQKMFEYLVVPKRKGRFFIQPEFSYFDTDINDYVTLKSSRFDVNVLQGSGTQTAVKLDKDNLQDIMGISNSTSLYKTYKPFFGSIPHVGLLSLPFLSLVGMFIYKRKLVKEAGIDPALRRRSAAQTLAMQRLVAAEQEMRANQSMPFFEEISNGIFGYVSDKFSISPAEINKEIIIETLLQNNIESNKVEDFKTLMNKCQMALYAANTDTDMNAIYNEAVDLISHIETNVK